MESKIISSKDCPNLVAELLCHNAGSIYHCAKECGMGEKELYDFLKGECSIEIGKLDRLVRKLGHCSRDYLECKTLSYYDLDKEKHRRKVLVLCRNARYKKLIPTGDMAKKKIFLRAWYNRILLNDRIAN